MIDLSAIGSVDTCATMAVTGLLGTLMDTAKAAHPGRNAAQHAETLKRLGDYSAMAAKEFEIMLAMADARSAKASAA